MPGIPFNFDISTLSSLKSFHSLKKKEHFYSNNADNGDNADNADNAEKTNSCSKHDLAVKVEKDTFILDDNTKLTRVCPHNGCLLAHKGNEFVCPCHRSKFDKCGNCLEGPACPNHIRLD